MEPAIKNTLSEKLKKEYQIVIPRKIIEDRIDHEIGKIKHQVRIKGFRPGQVPLNVIKEKYGSSFRADESEKVISNTVSKIIKDNNLEIALSPKIDIKNYANHNEDLEFTAVFELFPKVEKFELNKLKLTKFDVEIEEEDITKTLNRFLLPHAILNPQNASYKAKLGDLVEIDYKGTIDGEEFAGGSAENYRLELGSKTMIDDFEDQLVGVKVGSKLVVKVQFPESYHREELASKTAKFAVTVNQVLVPDFAKIDDEFISKTFGIPNKEELKSLAKKRTEGDYKNLSDKLFKKELLDLLNKKYEFDLPEGLVEEELNRLWQPTEEELKKNPNLFKSEKEKEKVKQKKRELAIRMIRAGILFNKVASENKISVTQNEISAEIEKIAQSLGEDQRNMVAEYYRSNSEALQNLRSILAEEKIVDFILKQGATVERESIPAKKFIKLYFKQI